MDRFDSLFPHHKKNPELIDKPQMTIRDAIDLSPEGKWKILVWRPRGGIGDLLMLTPTFKAIKDELPNSIITFVTQDDYCDGALRSTLQGNPYVDVILDHQKVIGSQYHIVANMDCPCAPHEQPGSIPPNRIDLFASSVGLKLKDHRPFYHVTEEEKAWATEWLNVRRSLQKKPLFFYQPFASSQNRSAPLKLSKEILAHLRITFPDCRIVVPTHGTDWAPDINFEMLNCLPAKNYTIRLLAALCDIADVVIAPDSSILHVAGALNKPLVGLFGPTPPQSRLDRYPKSIAVCPGSKLKCFPCWYSNCAFHLSCWKNITVDMVLDGVQRVIEEKYGTYRGPTSKKETTSFVEEL